MTLHWIDFVMRFKRGGMALEAIREYVQLAIKGESTKPARKEILLETKEALEVKLIEIQESLDVITYKLDTYDQKCGPITMEMVNVPYPVFQWYFDLLTCNYEGSSVSKTLLRPVVDCK